MVNRIGAGFRKFLESTRVDILLHFTPLMIKWSLGVPQSHKMYLVLRVNWLCE